MHLALQNCQTLMYMGRITPSQAPQDILGYPSKWGKGTGGGGGAPQCEWAMGCGLSGHHHVASPSLMPVSLFCIPLASRPAPPHCFEPMAAPIPSPTALSRELAV